MHSAFRKDAKVISIKNNWNKRASKLTKRSEDSSVYKNAKIESKLNNFDSLLNKSNEMSFDLRK